MNRCFFAILFILGLTNAVAAQDTLKLEPFAILPGSEILQVGNHRMVIRANEIEWLVARYLDVYDLSDSTAPRMIDHCLPQNIYWGQYMETLYYQVQGDAALEDSILYVTLNEETDHGSVDPYQLIGPLTVKAHIIGTDRDLWDITILDSLYEEANGMDLTQYSLPRTVIRDGDYLIVGAGSWGVRIYDISDRVAPTQVAQIDTVAQIVSLWGNRLVLQRNRNLFDIFDITDPANPEVIGEIDISQEANRNTSQVQSLYDFMEAPCFSYYHDYLYVPTTTNPDEADPQIVVFDIMGNEPTEVARLTVSFNQSMYSKYINFTIGNNRLYTIHENLLDIYDLADPLTPRLVTTMTFDAHQSSQMIAQDDQLYVAYGGDDWRSDSAKVTIYNVGPNNVRPLPLLPSLLSLSPFPNPFNSSTTISYTLPKPGRYALDVVDIQGRLVTRLSNGWKEVGSYQSILQGGELPSGTLLLRLEGSGASAVQKVELVK